MPGDDKTCTITNKRKPKLTVVKVIEGGNGAAFDLKVNDATVLDDVDGNGGQVTNTYPVDTAYSVTETLGNGDPVDPAVWETTLSGDCAGSLAAGDDKTCTITNKRKPKLTVVKVIEGGNGAAFDLKVNDDVVLNDVGGNGGQVTNTYPVDGREGDRGRQRRLVRPQRQRLGRARRRWRQRRPGDEHVPGRHRLLGHGDARQRQRGRPGRLGDHQPAPTAPARSPPASTRPAPSPTSASPSSPSSR